MNKMNGKVEDHKTAALYHEGKEKMSQVYQTALEKTEEIGEHVKDTASHLYKQGKKKVSALEENVKDRPLTSMLIAGTIIGYILFKILKK